MTCQLKSVCEFKFADTRSNSDSMWNLFSNSVVYNVRKKELAYDEKFHFLKIFPWSGIENM